MLARLKELVLQGLVQAGAKLDSGGLPLGYSVPSHVFHLDLVDKQSLVLLLLHLAPLHVNLMQLLAPIVDLFLEHGVLLNGSLAEAHGGFALVVPLADHGRLLFRSQNVSVLEAALNLLLLIQLLLHSVFIVLMNLFLFLLPALLYLGASERVLLELAHPGVLLLLLLRHESLVHVPGQ